MKLCCCLVTCIFILCGCYNGCSNGEDIVLQNRNMEEDTEEGTETDYNGTIEQRERDMDVTGLESESTIETSEMDSES